MELGMDKEIQILQAKRDEACMRLRSAEIDLELGEKNPYATEQDKVMLKRIVAALRFNAEELERRVSGVEKAMRGEDDGTGDERKIK